MGLTKKLNIRISIIAIFIGAALFIIPIAMANATNTHSTDLEEGNSEYWEVSSNSASLSPETADDMTVEAWVKLESLPSSSGNNYNVYADYGNTSGSTNPLVALYIKNSDNKASFFVRDENNNYVEAVSTTVLSVGEWYHLAGTWDHDSNTAAIIVNGVQEANDTNSSINNVDVDTNDAPHVGAYGLSSTTGHYFDGLIDEVRIWDVARTVADVSGNYEQELVGTEQNLVAYWKLNNNGDDDAGTNDLTTSSAGFSSDTPFLVPPVLKVRKAADESVTSSTTLQDDDDLSATAAANTSYIVDGVLFVKSASSDPDIKVAFDVPAGATMDIGYIAATSNNRNSAGLLETDAAASAGIPVRRNNEPTIIRFTGSIEVGSTAGNVVLQWAQDNSDTDSVTIMEGSYLKLEDL